MKRRHITLVAGLAVCLFMLMNNALVRAQILSTIGEDASGGGGGSSSGGGGGGGGGGGSSSSRNRGHDHHDDDDDDSFLGNLIVGLFFSPSHSHGHSHSHSSSSNYHSNSQGIQYTTPDPPPQPYVDRRFASYPYDNPGVNGYLMPELASRVGEDGRFKWYGGRLTADYGSGDDLERVGGDLLFSTSSRFGLDAQGHWYNETTGGGHDELGIGDVNALFRWIESDEGRFISHIGIGMNWMDYNNHTDFGVNFTLSADIFLADPWCWTHSIDWGTIGHAELFRYRTTVGFALNRFEPFVGYEYLDIDRTHLNQFTAGVRLWF